MKTQQTTISEVRLIYRTKVKASERLQVKCSSGCESHVDLDYKVNMYGPDSNRSNLRGFT